MISIVNDGQSRAQKAAQNTVRAKYRQRYADRIAGSTTMGRIYWRMVLEIEVRRKLGLLVSKYAVYLSAIFLACLTTACSANLVDLIETSQISEDALPELADVQGEVDFPLVSLSNSDYSLFSVQVIPGIEPGNEETKRVLMMYEGTDAVLILAQEPVSSQVEPPSKRIKGEVSNHELVQLEQAVATLVPQETGYALYWEKNGVSIALTGNIDPEDMVDLAQSLQ